MAKRESKKQLSPSLGDPRRRHTAKPKETPPTYYPHEWVELTDAFVQVMSRVGQRDLTRSCFIRDLRSGQLGSMKILPDGTMTVLNQSDWQQRTVEAPMHPQEGVRVDPYLDAHVYVQLAARLKAATNGRADDAPLLLQDDGSAWDKNPGQNYHRQVDKVVTAIGRDPTDVTVYCLRHSSIVRALLANIPIRLIASLHNTSVAMIEKHYSKHIAEHADDLARVALLQHEPPHGGNVVAMR